MTLDREVVGFLANAPVAEHVEQIELVDLARALVDDEPCGLDGIAGDARKQVEEAIELFLGCPAAEAYERAAATLKTFDDLLRDRMTPDPWRGRTSPAGVEPDDPD